MTRALYLAGADRTTQNFTRKYGGAPIQPNVGALHTTEGTGWPDYNGGATTPHATGMPAIPKRCLEWRQHLPFTRSARALENDPGGVETNTLNAVQLELIGTCDPTKRVRWGRLTAGKHYIFWPEAPDWALDGVAEVLAFLHEEWAIQLKAPKLWLPYPDSYGSKNGQRMSFAQWRRFYGWCGHQHVPENAHGDPGDLDIEHILAKARELTAPAKKRTGRADKVHELATAALKSKQSKARKQKWETIQEAAASLSTRY